MKPRFEVKSKKKSKSTRLVKAHIARTVHKEATAKVGFCSCIAHHSIHGRRLTKDRIVDKTLNHGCWRQNTRAANNIVTSATVSANAIICHHKIIIV